MPQKYINVTPVLVHPTFEKSYKILSYTQIARPSDRSTMILVQDSVLPTPSVQRESEASVLNRAVETVFASTSQVSIHDVMTWASCHIREIAGHSAHAQGIPGTFSLPPWVNDPDMHFIWACIQVFIAYNCFVEHLAYLRIHFNTLSGKTNNKNVQVFLEWWWWWWCGWW